MCNATHSFRGRQETAFAPFCDGCGVRLPSLQAHAIACPACGGDLNTAQQAAAGQPTHERWVAGLLSAALPGAGQVYNGEFFKGFAVLATCWLVIPWAFGVIDAWRTAERNSRMPAVSAFA